VLGSFVLLAAFAELALEALDELLDELQAATTIVPAASMAAAETVRLYCDRLTGLAESRVI